MQQCLQTPKGQRDRMAKDNKIIITHVENITFEDEQPEKEPAFSYVPAGPQKGGHNKKRLSPRFLMLIMAMLLALGTGALIYTLTSRDAGACGVTGSSHDLSAAYSSESSVQESAVSSPSHEPEPESAVETVSEPDETPVYDVLTPPDDYDYARPVPEAAVQDEQWFDDAVFVGNSRTQGLLLYTGLTAASYADVGLTVETAFTSAGFNDPAPEPDAEESGAAAPEKVTAAQALERDQYRKVYLMFGINELGWSSEDVFFDKYGSLIDTIRSSHPDAQIYVQSILPVSADKQKETAYLNNGRIEAFNARLQQLAEEKEVFYLDVASVFRDENGALPAELSNDGVHLKKDGFLAWKGYLLRHCVTSEQPSEGASGQKYAGISVPHVSSNP